jgi:hypothetical protein
MYLLTHRSRTYGIIVRFITLDLRYEVFSQTRLALTMPCWTRAARGGAAQFFTNFVVRKGRRRRRAQLPAVFDKNAKLGKLSGFSNASGLTADDTGHVFFADAASANLPVR